MNKTILTGRISNEFEIRKTANNTSIARIFLAVDKNIKDENGNRLADFIRVDVWGKSADFLSQYAPKGSLIGVVGRVSTNNFVNKEGNKVYETYITAENVEILNKPQEKKETQAKIDFTKDDVKDFIDDDDLDF